MPGEPVHWMAREEPEAFRSVVAKAPDGRLKDALEGVIREEIGDE